MPTEIDSTTNQKFCDLCQHFTGMLTREEIKKRLRGGWDLRSAYFNPNERLFWQVGEVNFFRLSQEGPRVCSAKGNRVSGLTLCCVPAEFQPR